MRVKQAQLQNMRIISLSFRKKNTYNLKTFFFFRNICLKFQKNSNYHKPVNFQHIWHIWMPKYSIFNKFLLSVFLLSKMTSKKPLFPVFLLCRLHCTKNQVVAVSCWLKMWPFCNSICNKKIFILSCDSFHIFKVSQKLHITNILRSHNFWEEEVGLKVIF